MESPRSGGRVVLHDPNLVVLLAQLTADTDLAVSGLPRGVVAAVVDLMATAHMLADAEEAGDQRLVQWAPADLLFHQASRRGRHAEPFGATFHLKGRFALPPAIKRDETHDVVFERPALDSLCSSDPPLQRVIEDRRSVRGHNDAYPITANQLSEFLYRTLAVRDETIAGISQRPYPGGGGLRGVEVYPLIRRCRGIDTGLYHYDAAAHALKAVCTEEPPLRALLGGARMSASLEHDPQVLLILTTRVGRLMWKYQSIAYATALKDIGILLHQFYLVATAMGLAPCALGGGDSERFARATQLDPYEEPNMAEFMLGSRSQVS